MLVFVTEYYCMGFPIAGQGKQFHKAMRYKEHIDGNTPNLSLSQ
jgi:hypothetical protein